MGFFTRLVRGLDDERKTGRTFTVFAVLVIVLRTADASSEAIDLGATAELYAGLLTPVVEYAWRKARSSFGLERTGTGS